jgi:hypothetical protein
MRPRAAGANPPPRLALRQAVGKPAKVAGAAAATAGVQPTRLGDSDAALAENPGVVADPMTGRMPAERRRALAPGHQARAVARCARAPPATAWRTVCSGANGTKSSVKRSCAAAWTVHRRARWRSPSTATTCAATVRAAGPPDGARGRQDQAQGRGGRRRRPPRDALRCRVAQHQRLGHLAGTGRPPRRGMRRTAQGATARRPGPRPQTCTPQAALSKCHWPQSPLRLKPRMHGLAVSCLGAPVLQWPGTQDERAQ